MELASAPGDRLLHELDFEVTSEYWQKKYELAQRDANWYRERLEYLGDAMVEIEQTLLDEIVRLRAELGLPRKNSWELP